MSLELLFRFKKKPCAVSSLISTEQHKDLFKNHLNLVMIFINESNPLLPTPPPTPKQKLEKTVGYFKINCSGFHSSICNSMHWQSGNHDFPPALLVVTEG